ncbi:membrane protein insertion efficiency factor YidD [Serratia rubidaea]|uniref:membrane protein insertion efficiency factor YidD n=1 Tax=Serratia rubidaea TaxID=61652 RepID=UPI0009006715
MILIYRRIAPRKVRDRCRYYPSCSKYALISIKRFGFLTGWRLSIARLRRCCPPNGGIDYPPHRSQP